MYDVCTLELELSTNIQILCSGTAQQVFKGGGGGGGGAKEECAKEIFLGAGGGEGWHACGFLLNFSKVTENAISIGNHTVSSSIWN